MKIELAKHSGFCFGVKNAIVRVVEKINISEDPILVYGPLIHNPQTVQILEERGLKTIHSLDGIDGKQVAIRTHGVPVEDMKVIKERSSKIFNLTCPKVARVQSIIKTYSVNGCHTIIIGDADHAEIVGLKSFASSGVTIISSIDELNTIPAADKYLLVAQTTIDKEFFESIVSDLMQKLDNLTVIETICDSTANRQNDVHEGIAKGIDTLIVVGGKNSANTTRLADIGRENGIKTMHVETDNDFSSSDLQDSRHVLVTAGASTPGWIINNVLERLYNIKYKRSNIFSRAIKLLFEFVSVTNILSAIFAFFAALFIQSTAYQERDLSVPLIAMLYIFSLYSINNYFDREFLKTSNTYKYKIYKKYGRLLMVISLFFMVSSFYFIRNYSQLSIILMVLVAVLGFLYFTRPVKQFVSSLGLPFINEIYGSKIVTFIGWLTVVVVVPSIEIQPNAGIVLLMSVFVFSLIAERHILIGIIAFQGDFIFGRMSLPIWLGQKHTHILAVFLSFIAGVCCIFVAINREEYILLILLVPTLYYYMMFQIMKRVEYPISIRYEILTDINFIVSIACFLLIMN